MVLDTILSLESLVPFEETERVAAFRDGSKCRRLSFVCSFKEKETLVFPVHTSVVGMPLHSFELGGLYLAHL